MLRILLYVWCIMIIYTIIASMVNGREYDKVSFEGFQSTLMVVPVDSCEDDMILDDLEDHRPSDVKYVDYVE